MSKICTKFKYSTSDKSDLSELKEYHYAYDEISSLLKHCSTQLANIKSKNLNFMLELNTKLSNLIECKVGDLTASIKFLVTATYEDRTGVYF